MQDKLFTEKLRPKILSDVLCLPRITNIFKDEKLQMNYIFYGSPGLGKTSLAKILAKNYPTLYINGSDETSVEVIRTKITDFCSTLSILQETSATTKVIILDEIDGASNQFFKALKVPLEKFSHCRFVAITNHINEIEEGVLSRFIPINFDPNSAEEERELFAIYEKRTKTLFKKMNVKISDEVNYSFIKKHFPDMRKIISILQHIHISKVEEVTEQILLQHTYSFTELYDNILNKPDPVLNYKLICGEYKDRYREVLSSLGDDFLQWLSEKDQQKYERNIASIIIEVADWQSKINSMIDPHLGLLACFFKIQSLLNK